MVSPPQPVLKVLVFAASLRAESVNRKLAELAARVATRHGAIVRGGKPDAAFGVKLPRKPHQALRVRRKR